MVGHTILVNKLYLAFLHDDFYLRHLPRTQNVGNITREVQWHYPAVKGLSRYGLSCAESSSTVILYFIYQTFCILSFIEKAYPLSLNSISLFQSLQFPPVVTPKFSCSSCKISSLFFTSPYELYHKMYGSGLVARPYCSRFTAILHIAVKNGELEERSCCI
jgi:hypothetical protein